jgi:hypothetical protein
MATSTDRTSRSTMRPSSRSNHFILETFDRELWCPIAQTRFHVDDVASLRAILGADADDDPELSHYYIPDDDQLAALTARFGARFDRSEFASADVEIALARPERRALPDPHGL